MWYEKNKKNELDYSKPIFAEPVTSRELNSKYLLVPCKNKGSYEVIGYKWLNLITGLYLVGLYSTPVKAINHFNAGTFDVFNAKITLDRIKLHDTWCGYNSNIFGVSHSKPIIAEDKYCSNNKFLLLPQTNIRDLKAYDWFDMNFGRYNSNLCMDSIKEAMETYKYSYNFYNANITIKRY